MIRLILLALYAGGGPEGKLGEMKELREEDDGLGSRDRLPRITSKDQRNFKKPRAR